MTTEVEIRDVVESRFRSMADKAPVLIWETDETGVINVNGHYLDYFGVSLEQVLGMGWAAYLHPDDADGYIGAYLQASSHRKPYDYQCRFRNAAGEYRWLRNSGVPIGENRYVGSSTDVTELVETQESLRKTQQDARNQRQEMQLKLDSAALASWYCDLDAGLVGGDKRTFELFGLEGHAVPVEKWLELIVEEDRTRVAAAFEESLKGAPYNVEFRVRRGGKVCWLRSAAKQIITDGQVTSIVGILEDVSKQKEDQRILNETVDRLALAQEVANLAAWDWDLRTGDILWDEKGTEVYGRPVDEVDHIDKVFPLIHPDDAAEVELQMAPVKLGAPEFESEFRVCWPDGSYHWLTGRGISIADERGAVVRLIGINFDITERRIAEAALRQSEKLAAVGQLASTIAHEINNPLESVTNLLYICKSTTTDPEVLHYLTMAEIELRRVSVITNQTLRFHKQRTAPTAITCLDLFSSSLLIFQGRLDNSNIQVAKRKRAEQPVMCLEGEIRQVMNNLIGNAIDAMKRGGTLAIRSLEATDWRTGRQGLRLTIADTGTGIDPRMMKNLFQPFQTTKGINGTGLGLWVSHEIIERHKGRLLVRTSTKQGHSGTVFSLFLPFHALETVENSTEPNVAKSF